MSLCAEPTAQAMLSDPPCLGAPRRLDTCGVGLGSVIWATLNWVDLPVLDANDAPRREHGVAPVLGIYLPGFPWRSKMNASFLSGVGEDAARLAEHIHQLRTSAGQP